MRGRENRVRAGEVEQEGMKERQTGRQSENKQCQSNGIGDRDLVPLNIDSSVMGHEIYMEY